ncbi:MAG: hypothetical protein D6725_03705 [Planctomycetota bacterium]|nr:MAG: hypothetical protein D6725_03705 [Planctomycetota bacterium]
MAGSEVVIRSPPSLAGRRFGGNSCVEWRDADGRGASARSPLCVTVGQVRRIWPTFPMEGRPSAYSGGKFRRTKSPGGRAFRNGRKGRSRQTVGVCVATAFGLRPSCHRGARRQPTAHGPAQAHVVGTNAQQWNEPRKRIIVSACFEL